MNDKNESGFQLVWFSQPALTLHQAIGWIMFRDPLVPECIGDTVGRNTPTCYSQRPRGSGTRYLTAEINKPHAVQVVGLTDAMSDITQKIVVGKLRCTGIWVDSGTTDRPRREIIDPAEFDSMRLDVVTGGAVDRALGREVQELRFPTAAVLELWPDKAETIQQAARTVDNVAAAPRRSKKVEAAKRVIEQIKAQNPHSGSLTVKEWHEKVAAIVESGISIRSVERALRETAG